ncbi:MAG TPA: hypothetical protein PKN75_14545 [Bacteroidia bacterium]|nr:hypothetical protein [Bacteroidia bacterium]HNU34804.1 hypothetical protein [Bacteroidia bacterium]
MQASLVKYILLTILLVVLPLIIGISIYILFRGQDSIFTKAELHPPTFLIYNLPDALWLFSLCNLLSLIWRAQWRTYALWYGSVTTLSVITEYLQYNDIIIGTGDIWDCVAYILACTTSIAIYCHLHSPSNNIHHVKH